MQFRKKNKVEFITDNNDLVGQNADYVVFRRAADEFEGPRK